MRTAVLKEFEKFTACNDGEEGSGHRIISRQIFNEAHDQVIVQLRQEMFPALVKSKLFQKFLLDRIADDGNFAVLKRFGARRRRHPVFEGLQPQHNDREHEVGSSSLHKSDSALSTMSCISDSDDDLAFEFDTMYPSPRNNTMDSVVLQLKQRIAITAPNIGFEVLEQLDLLSNPAYTQNMPIQWKSVEDTESMEVELSRQVFSIGSSSFKPKFCRVSAVVPFSLEDVVHAFSCDSGRRATDRYLTDLTAVDYVSVEETCRNNPAHFAKQRQFPCSVVHERFKFPFPVNNRESLVAETLYRDANHNRYYFLRKSCILDDAKIPASGGGSGGAKRIETFGGIVMNRTLTGETRYCAVFMTNFNSILRTSKMAVSRAKAMHTGLMKKLHRTSRRCHDSCKDETASALLRTLEENERIQNILDGFQSCAGQRQRVMGKTSLTSNERRVSSRHKRVLSIASTWDFS